jgi:hypothetical protein
LHVVGDGLFSGVVTAGGAANIDSSLSFQISTSGSGTQRWFGANKNGSYGLLVGYSEATSLSGVGAYIRQVTSDPMFFVVNNTTTALTLAATGAATFSSSVTATAFFASSDIRLKDIIAHDGDMITYKWKDGRDDKIHYGYSAQNLQKINPNLVNKNDDGFLSVNYTETLVLKVRELEKRVKELEAN